MHYYLTRWAGDGTIAPYEPAAGLAGAAWSVIDLRPDPTRPDGVCLLATTERPSRTTDALHLGDDPAEALPVSVRGRLANALGLTLDRADLRRIILELLVDHARTDGGRWRPLHPLTCGPNVWEVHLGGLMWAVPRVAGGATHTETFTGADNLSIAAADVDLTWAVVDTGWSVNGNTAQILAESTGTAYARAEHDVTTTNHYAQATYVSKVDGAGIPQFAPCVRFSSSANTSYMACRGQDAATDLRLRKTVTGTRTNLASAATITVALPEVIRTEADGSTIRGLINSTQHTTVTDTSITTGTRGGIYGFRPTSGGVVLDGFSVGDIITVVTGTLNGVGPVATGTIAATVTTAGMIGGTAPAVTGSIAGTLTATGYTHAQAPAPVGAISGTLTTSGELVGTAPVAAGTVTGVLTAGGALTAVGPMSVGALAGTLTATGTIGGAAPAATGRLTAFAGQQLATWPPTVGPGTPGTPVATVERLT